VPPCGRLEPWFGCVAEKTDVAGRWILRIPNRRVAKYARQMKAWLSFLAGAAVMLGVTGFGSNPSRHVYELRMYHVNPGKMDSLIKRFGDHTDALFKQHNMKSIGYWRPQDSPGSQNLFVYILEHSSREEAKKNWDEFQADPEWQRVKAQSEAEGKLVDHIDSYFMEPTPTRRRNRLRPRAALLKL
jgi:hypothetical protein